MGRIYYKSHKKKALNYTDKTIPNIKTNMARRKRLPLDEMGIKHFAHKLNA